MVFNSTVDFISEALDYYKATVSYKVKKMKMYIQQILVCSLNMAEATILRITAL